MNSIEYRKISEVANLTRGKVYSKQYIQENQGKFPLYSSQTQNEGLLGMIDSYDFDGEYINWTTDGAYAGSVFYRNGKFSVTNVSGIIDVHDNNVNKKYLYYILGITTQKHVNKGMGNPKLMSNVMGEIVVPIPPLEVQKEIVEILDKFTTLEAELEAELEARKKQYEYYFARLINLSSGDTGFGYIDEMIKSLTPQVIEYKTIENIGKFRRGSFPQPYGLDKWYDEKNGAPFVQVVDVENDQFLLVPRTRRKISLAAQAMSVFAPKGTVIVTIQGTIGRIAITQYDAFIDRTLLIFTEIDSNINQRYLAYALKYKFQDEEKTARGSTLKTITIEELKNFQIPIPPIEIQNEIARILDNFSDIANSITIGLPKEIELRRKQYEYYRNKLLTFEEL